MIVNFRIHKMAHLAIFPLFISVIGCGSPEPQEKTIKASQGENIYIELPSNRSTGYSWTWANKKEATGVDSVGVIYEVTKTRSAGESGIEIWNFEVKEKGEELIVMEYKRVWKEEEPAQIKHFTVIVE